MTPMTGKLSWLLINFELKAIFCKFITDKPLAANCIWYRSSLSSSPPPSHSFVRPSVWSFKTVIATAGFRVGTQALQSTALPSLVFVCCGIAGKEGHTSPKRQVEVKLKSAAGCNGSDDELESLHGPQKRVRGDCFGSVHAMSCGWHDIGCEATVKKCVFVEDGFKCLFLTVESVFA